MRPRKKVLIVTPDTVKASLTRFQLDIWGFAPMTAETAEIAEALLLNNDIETMLVLAPGFEELIVHCKRFSRRTSVVVHGFPNPPSTLADVQISAIASMETIRETIRMAASRKQWRGPHKLEVACAIAGD